MKKVFRYILLFAFCLSLWSCSPAEELRLICGEIGEITQFFSPPISDRESEYASFAEKSAESEPVLAQLKHAELLDSPYNSGVDVSAVSSVRVTDKLYTFGAEKEASDGDKFGYTFVDKIENREYSAVEQLFAAAGVATEVVRRANSAPEGEVFAIEYAGFSCSDGYYVNPFERVVLYLSGEKPAKTAAEGDNLVYITFDDGPSAKNTARLLEILDTYGVKAAFFTTGEAIQKYPESARAVVERGHVLGCHSVTHDYKKIYASVESLEEEVEWWEEIAAENGITREMLGQLTFRFPGGSVGSYFDEDTAEEMKRMLEGRGYFIYDWNVVTNDSILYMAPGGTRSYDYIMETFGETLDLCLKENREKSGAPIIILMHETVGETVELLPWLLEYLIGEGYTFGNLADMGRSWTFADR